MRVLVLLGALVALAACSPNGESAEAAADPTAEIRARMPATPEERLAQANDFMTANGAREGVTTTESGLEYEVLASGPADGTSPAPGAWVCVHYRGAFLDGSEFDSSYSRGQAAAFPSDRVIEGWVEALAMMKPGDAWRLYIHPDLGYGPQGRPGIPPNSTLLFDVSLIKVLDGPVEQGADCASDEG